MKNRLSRILENGGDWFLVFLALKNNDFLLICFIDTLVIRQ